MNVCKQQFKIFDILDYEILLSILNTFTKEDYRKWNNVNEAGYILLIWKVPTSFSKTRPVN